MREALSRFNDLTGSMDIFHRFMEQRLWRLTEFEVISNFTLISYELRQPKVRAFRNVMQLRWALALFRQRLHNPCQNTECVFETKTTSDSLYVLWLLGRIRE